MFPARDWTSVPTSLRVSSKLCKFSLLAAEGLASGAAVALAACLLLMFIRYSFSVDPTDIRTQWPKLLWIS